MRNSSMRGLLLLGMILWLVPVGATAQILDTHPHGPAPTKLTDCTGCHQCQKPTPENPCLNKCPRHGSHFFGKHEAGDGPEVIIIDQLADLYRPVVFAHRLHADMSNMTGGCQNCHHYSEMSGTIPPCRECHDATKSPVSLDMPALKGAYHRQCMNCHLDWSGGNACGFCHEQVKGPLAAAVDSTDIVDIPHPLIEAVPSYTYQTTYEKGPVVSFHHTDHVEMFDLKCVDCHRGDSCSSCHHATDGTSQRARLDHVTTCYSCHSKRDCGFCHHQTARPNFEHTRTAGWALEPYHTEVSCKVCHGSPRDFKTPSDKCTSCHIHWEEGGFDHLATGLVLSEDHVELDCRDCHLEMDFSRQPSSAGCHDDPMLPDNLPGIRVRIRR